MLLGSGQYIALMKREQAERDRQWTESPLRREYVRLYEKASRELTASKRKHWVHVKPKPRKMKHILP